MDHTFLRSLIKKLRSWRVTTRRSAARFFVAHAKQFREGELHATSLIHELAKALSDRDVEVRECAAEALSELGELALPALEALCRATGDDKETVSEHAVHALNGVGTPGIRAILHLYRKAEIRQKRNLIRGLIMSFEKVKNIEPEVARAAVATLIEALSSRDTPLRKSAATAFGWYEEYAQPAVPYLLEAVKDNDPEVRTWAAKSLTCLPIAIGGTIEPAVRLLGDSEEKVRRQMCGTLGFLGKRAEVAAVPIVEFLLDPKEEMRREAKQALGWIGPKAVPVLAARLKDKNVAMRRAAATALIEFYEYCPAAIAALLEALKDEDKEVRKNAASSLMMYGERAEPAVPLLIEMLDDAELRKTVAYTLRGIGPAAKSAVPALISALRDDIEAGRSDVVRALGAIHGQDESMVPHFARSLDDSEDDVRKEALKALNALGPKAVGAVPALLKLRADESHRFLTAIVLARIGHDVTLIVRELLEDFNSKESLSEVIETLGEMGAAAREAEPVLMRLFAKTLRAAAKESNPWERATIICVVVKVAKSIWQITGQSEFVLPPLVELLVQGGPAVDEYVCDVFHTMGSAAKPAVPSLMAALQREDNWDGQWAASDALCAIGPDAALAIPALIGALRSPSTAQWATRVLGTIGVAAVPALIEGLRTPNPQTREWAADALGRIGPDATIAAPELMELLDDTERKVRWWSAIALAKIKPDPAALSLLIEASQVERRRDVRKAAVEGLGNLGSMGENVVASLKDALEDGDREVRLAACRTLEHMKKPGTGLREKDPTVS